MTTAPTPTVANPDWHSLFHTRDEVRDAPPITYAIEGFLQNDALTMLGGLPGHGKTLVAFAMAQSLLEGTNLFGYHRFKVPKPSDRVVYLIPEAALAPVASRLKVFRLDKYVGSKLFVRSLSMAEEQDIAITDPRLRKACEGADVFLDTAVRFMEATDENSSAEQRIFAKNLFALLKAGARTVTGLHHSPKSFESANYMSLENILRGSGDIGAMLATCWGMALIEKHSTRIWIENVKPREFDACEPLIVEGRPWLDQTGQFKLTHSDGSAGSYNTSKPRYPGGARPSGRPPKEDKVDAAMQMRAQGMSNRSIANALRVDEKTVRRWLEAAGMTPHPKIH